MTPSQPSQHETGATHETVPLDRQLGIARAARLESTRRRQPGRDQGAIGAKQEYTEPAGHRRRCAAQSSTTPALRARRHRTPPISLPESRAASERPITTRSTPPTRHRRERRNHSRTRRFTRLRTTARPTFRLTVTPSRSRPPWLPALRPISATSRTKAGSAARLPSPLTRLNSLDLSNRSPRR